MKVIYRLILIVFLGLYGPSLMAQEAAALRGKVAGASGNAIEGAFVRILNTNLGTVTDADGFFSLPVKPGKYTVYVTAIGYTGRERTVDVTQAGGDASTIVLDEEAVALDNIVVTAQKEEEDLQRVPFSISALSSRKISEYRIWNTKDIAGITPNLYSSNPGDNRNVTSVRGIATTSYDPAVATYIDGVNQFGLDTYIAPLFDVERIEVLRGPQGTLYGRNAMGGVINIITRKPTNVTNGFAEASVGNYGQQRYSIGVRTPLVKNKLFLGVAGMYDRMNGFYTNTFNNTDFDKKHSFTGNYYLTWLVNPAWSVTANVKNHAHRNDGSFTLAGSPEEALEHPFEVNQNTSTTLVDNILNGSLAINHSGSGLNFSSLTTYQSNYRYYETPIDGDFSPLDIVNIANNYGHDWNRVQVYTQEFKFSSPASTASPFKWTAGTYMYYQDNPVKQATQFGANGDLYGAAPNSAMITTSTGKNRGIAFYGQATYSIAEQLDVTAGVRYDYEHRKLNVAGDYQEGDGPAFPMQADTSGTVSYSAFSPKAGLTYHLNERHHAYAVYSRGFRTGGLTQYSGDPTQPPLYSYKPEYSNNFEIGVKNSFLENRINVNFSAFFVKVTDVQVPSLILPQAWTVTRNAGKLTSKGVELEVTATPINGLQVDYALGVTDATYDELNVAVTQDDGEAGVVSYKGNKQLFTPSATSMLAVQYSYPLTKSLRVVARGEWMYFGETYYNLANTIRQSSYALFNTRAGFTWHSFDVMFWMRNIGNKRYISYAYDFGATRLGDPRNLGVTVRKSF